MDRFHITGPTRLAGRVEIGGAKNAALPALAASLLTDATLELSGLPRVRDLKTLTALLQHLGVECVPNGSKLTLRHSTTPQLDDAPYELVKNHAGQRAGSRSSGGPTRLGSSLAPRGLCHRRAPHRSASGGPAGARRRGPPGTRLRHRFRQAADWRSIPLRPCRLSRAPRI